MIPHTAKVLTFNDSVQQTDLHDNSHTPTEHVLLNI